MTNGRESSGENFIPISRAVPEILNGHFWRESGARSRARGALLGMATCAPSTSLAAEACQGLSATNVAFVALFALHTIFERYRFAEVDYFAIFH